MRECTGRGHRKRERGGGRGEGGKGGGGRGGGGNWLRHCRETSDIGASLPKPSVPINFTSSALFVKFAKRLSVKTGRNMATKHACKYRHAS